MDKTDNLRLPYIIAAQAQKHVTHKEALRTLDALVHLTVLDKDLNTPPASPADGDRYIVATAPTGAWSGQAGAVAAWQDGAWAFHAPREGWLAWIADEARLYVLRGGAWGPVPTVFDTGSGILDSDGKAQLTFHATLAPLTALPSPTPPQAPRRRWPRRAPMPTSTSASPPKAPASCAVQGRWRFRVEHFLRYGLSGLQWQRATF